jgi:hypothetical protein
MKVFLTGLDVTLVSATFPTAWAACSTLTPGAEKRAEAKMLKYLAEADLVVIGRWKETGRDSEGYWSIGTVEFVRDGRTERIRASSGTEINCRYPHYPSPEQTGRFYLKKRSSTDGYTIIHFVSTGSTD